MINAKTRREWTLLFANNLARLANSNYGGNWVLAELSSVTNEVTLLTFKGIHPITVIGPDGKDEKTNTIVVTVKTHWET